MPDLDHLRIGGTTYDLKDSTAREKDAVQDNELNSLKSALNTLESETKYQSIELQSVIENSNYFVRYENGNLTAYTDTDATGFIRIDGFVAIRYRRMGSTYSSSDAGVAFYDKDKNYVYGIPSVWNQEQAGYIQKLQTVYLSSNIVYARFTAYHDTQARGKLVVYGVSGIAKQFNEVSDYGYFDVPFHTGEENKLVLYASGRTASASQSNCTEYIPISDYAEIAYKRIGVTYNDTTAGIAFYDSNKTYISGIQHALNQAEGGYLAELYHTTPPPNAAFARFTFFKDFINRGFFELYAKSKNAVRISQIDGSQWAGKNWYAYGTSITNISNEGKYPTYLAQMSGLVLTNKGISGGGIGNLGGYARGQVYAAICNTTDGKLDADLITLETGANDVTSGVPLGTIYDNGTSTLSGCLNDCIRYLQKNTNAQICVLNSPASTTEPNETNQYYKWADMVRQICDINRVHFLNNNSNMGYAKIADPTKGSLYVVDSIHQTNLGGFIMAQNLWYQLRNIPLFYTTIPT